MPTDDDQKYRGAERRNGPSLGEYLETRLKLLDKHLDDVMDASDLRYQQRFEAQSAALTAAFLAQQTAMATALLAAKEAVQAALAAAALATSKAEDDASDRSRGVVEKIDEVGGRIDKLGSRFDTLAGQLAGGGQGNAERRSQVASVMQVVGGVVGLIVLALLLWRAFSGN